MLVFVFLSAAPVLSQNILDDILAPFEGLDIATTYDKYNSVIDFILYLIVFISIANVSLAKLLGGHGGKAVSVVVGISLAVSLSVWSAMANFSIKSFGPVAALIFMLVVGVAIYEQLKKVGLGKTGFFGSFIIMYFMMRSLSPEMFNWLATNYPAVNKLIYLLLGIGVVLMIIKLFNVGSRFATGGRIDGGGGGHGFMNAVKKAKKEVQEIKEEEKETHEEKKDIKKEVKVTKHLIKEVHDIVNQIGDVEKNPEDAGKHFDKITKDIKKIHKNEDKLFQLLQAIKELQSKVEKDKAMKEAFGHFDFDRRMQAAEKYSVNLKADIDDALNRFEGGDYKGAKYRLGEAEHILRWLKKNFKQMEKEQGEIEDFEKGREKTAKASAKS